MTKADANALLATPRPAPQLNETSHASLVAMFDAKPAADALDADLRDARADDTPPTRDQMPRDESNHLGNAPDAPEPTLQAVLDGLTAFEKNVLVAHPEAGIAC